MNSHLPGRSGRSVQEIWEDFSLSFTPAVREVVEFAKHIPGFQALSQHDQVTLLKAGTFEVRPGTVGARQRAQHPTAQRELPRHCMVPHGPAWSRAALAGAHPPAQSPTARARCPHGAPEHGAEPHGIVWCPADWHSAPRHHRTVPHGTEPWHGVRRRTVPPGTAR